MSTPAAPEHNLSAVVLLEMLAAFVSASEIRSPIASAVGSTVSLQAADCAGTLA